MGAKLRRRVQSCLDKNQNLFDVFSEVTSKHPEKTAIVFIDDGRKWTFSELKTFADRVACYFSSIGVVKGDVVALFVENCPEHIGRAFKKINDSFIFILVLEKLSLSLAGLSLGLWKLGAVTAYINTNLRHSSLLHCLSLSRAKCLVFSSSLAEHLSAVEGELEGALASGPMFSVGHGAGGGERVRDLEVELENVSDHKLPFLPDTSLSGEP